MCQAGTVTPPSLSVSSIAGGFILFSAQNKMMLSWAALSFPFQNNGDLIMQRSQLDGLILGKITEEAEDQFWEHFTGQTHFSLFYSVSVTT